MTAAGRSAGATRGSAIRLAAEAAARALSLGLAVLVSLGLGVERFGAFAALSAVAVLAGQGANFGTAEIACPALVAGRLSLRALVRARLALTLVVLAVALAAAAVGLRPSGAGLHGTAAAFALLVTGAVLTAWVEFVGVALRSRGRPFEEAALLVLGPGGALAAAAVALDRGAGVTGVAAALVLGTLPALALGAVLAARAPAVEKGGDGVRDVLAASWPLALNGALALASLRVELFAVALLRGPREAGIFALALRIVEALNAASGAVAAGALPAMTREAATRAVSFARTRTSAAVALLALPGVAALVLLAPRLLAWWGGGYEPAGAVLQVLALALVPMYLNAVQLHALIACGEARRLPGLTAVRVGVSALLAPALAIGWGASGAAAGLVAAEVVLLVIANHAGRRAGFAIPLGGPLALGLAAAVPTAAAVAAAGAGVVAPLASGAAAWALALGAVWWAVEGRRSRRLDVGYL